MTQERQLQHDPEREEQETEQKPKIHVVDRRFWARDDDDDDSGGRADKPAYVQQLEEQLREKDAQLTGTVARYQQAKTEFENAKARSRREMQKELQQYKRSVLVELLEVVDNLDRALETPQQDAADAASVLDGVRMVREQFLAKLSGLGVRRIDTLHQPFDPACHEAVSMVPVAEPEQDGRVVGVIREGYLLGDDVLRPSVVAVGQSSKGAA